MRPPLHFRRQPARPLALEHLPRRCVSEGSNHEARLIGATSNVKRYYPLEQTPQPETGAQRVSSRSALIRSEPCRRYCALARCGGSSAVAEICRVGSRLPCPGALLGDWTAKSFALGRRKFVIALNERTYLVALSPLLRLPGVLAALAASVCWQLEQLGVPPGDARSEAEEFLRPTFVKNDSKSLLGSLNDLAYLAEPDLSEVSRDASDELLRAAAQLSETPHLHRNPVRPTDAVRKLFALPARATAG